MYVLLAIAEILVASGLRRIIVATVSALMISPIWP